MGAHTWLMSIPALDQARLIWEPPTCTRVSHWCSAFHTSKGAAPSKRPKPASQGPRPSSQEGRARHRPSREAATSGKMSRLDHKPRPPTTPRPRAHRPAWRGGSKARRQAPANSSAPATTASKCPPVTYTPWKLKNNGGMGP